MEVLWVVAALALGAGGGWFARGLWDGETPAEKEQFRKRAGADQLVDFLQKVNATRDAATAGLVRGIVWDVYRGNFREYVTRRVDIQPTPPDPPTGPNS
jgi:hypothetical protein